MKKNRIMVFGRATPTAKQLPEACSVIEEYKALLAKRHPEVQLDMVCAIEGQLAWMEYWPDKAVLQAFYQEYMGFSDLPMRLMNASRYAPERLHFQEVSAHL